MREKIKPSLVLMIICIASSLLLVLAHEATKENIAEQKIKKFQTSVEALFGECEYNLLESNFGEDDITAIAVTADGRTALRMSVDGYEKDGIEVLIGIDQEGAVCGIEFVSLKETPGVGSKIRDEDSFCRQFIGVSSAGENFDAITGATYSSRGMISAVDKALEVYSENKEAILNG